MFLVVDTDKKGYLSEVDIMKVLNRLSNNEIANAKASHILQ